MIKKWEIIKFHNKINNNNKNHNNNNHKDNLMI